MQTAMMILSYYTALRQYEIGIANNLVNEAFCNLVKYSESHALKLNPSKCYVIT